MRVNNITITLYDTKRDEELAKYIKDNYEYASIWHDKDIETETGEIKKKHQHIYIELPNARTIKSIAKEFKIEENRIEKVKSKKYMIRYLIHLDQQDKYQYQIKDIETNMEIIKYFENKENQEENIKYLLSIIELKGKIYIKEIIEIAIMNGMYKTLKNNQYLIKQVIEEHNKIIIENKKIKIEREKNI